LRCVVRVSLGFLGALTFFFGLRLNLYLTIMVPQSKVALIAVQFDRGSTSLWHSAT
jgi:hypothetical protein